MQRTSALRPSRRNVPGAAIGPLLFTLTVENGPQRPLVTTAAKGRIEPKLQIFCAAENVAFVEAGKMATEFPVIY